MDVNTIVNDVKGRVEPIVAKGQEVVETGFETLKSANAIIVEGVQTLVQTGVEAGKDLFAAAQSSFETAKAAGLKTVVADPIAYLPEGKDRVVSAYNDGLSVVTKAGEELVATLKDGFESINSTLTGKVSVAKAKTTVKRAAGKAKKAVKAAA